MSTAEQHPSVGPGNSASSVVVRTQRRSRPAPAPDHQTLDQGRFEVVLVDDASTDDTAAIAERNSRVHVVRSDGHIGPPRPSNMPSC